MMQENKKIKTIEQISSLLELLRSKGRDMLSKRTRTILRRILFRIIDAFLIRWGRQIGVSSNYRAMISMNAGRKEIDSLVKDSEAYLKRLKELRKQIEKRYQEKTIELNLKSFEKNRGGLTAASYPSIAAKIRCFDAGPSLKYRWPLVQGTISVYSAVGDWRCDRHTIQPAKTDYRKNNVDCVIGGTDSR